MDPNIFWKGSNILQDCFALLKENPIYKFTINKDEFSFWKIYYQFFNMFSCVQGLFLKGTFPLGLHEMKASKISIIIHGI